MGHQNEAHFFFWVRNFDTHPNETLPTDNPVCREGPLFDARSEAAYGSLVQRLTLKTHAFCVKTT